MWRENRIPIPTASTPDNEHPMKRHHTARYYAHRVKESLTTRVSKLVCAIFLFFLFLLGIITFILWLSLRPHRPRFLIEEFSIPALSQQAGTGFEKAVVTYNITARNVNQNMGVYYDSMHMTVFYDDQSIGGADLLFPFYQEPKNTTVISGLLGGASLTVSNQRWQQFLSDRGDGQVVFRVEISSVIRFKISTWDSKHHTMRANCAAAVGSDGFILQSYRDKRCPVYFSVDK